MLPPLSLLPPAPAAWESADNVVVFAQAKGPCRHVECPPADAALDRAQLNWIELNRGRGAVRRGGGGGGRGGGARGVAADETSKRTLEPAGRFFQAFANRRKYSRTFSEQERVDQSKKQKEADVEDDEDDEPETEDLLSLDPKQWKVRNGQRTPEKDAGLSTNAGGRAPPATAETGPRPLCRARLVQAALARDGRGL